MFLKTKIEEYTKKFYRDMPNGYQESIQKGLLAVRSFSHHMSYGKGTKDENICRLADEIETADAILIGAGSGLSTSAGFTYSGERFARYFFDFIEKYGISDIYSGGFYQKAEGALISVMPAFIIIFLRLTSQIGRAHV